MNRNILRRLDKTDTQTRIYIRTLARAKSLSYFNETLLQTCHANFPRRKQGRSGPKKIRYITQIKVDVSSFRRGGQRHPSAASRQGVERQQNVHISERYVNHISYKFPAGYFIFALYFICSLVYLLAVFRSCWRRLAFFPQATMDVEC